MRLSIKDVRTERKLLWIFEMFLKHNAGKCILIIEFMWLFLYYFILYIERITVWKLLKYNFGKINIRIRRNLITISKNWSFDHNLNFVLMKRIYKISYNNWKRWILMVCKLIDWKNFFYILEIIFDWTMKSTWNIKLDRSIHNYETFHLQSQYV